MKITPLKEHLERHVSDLRNTVRLYEMIKKIIGNCAGKPIVDDLVYNGLIFTSIDGVVLQATNCVQDIYKTLNVIKAHHLYRFSTEAVMTHLEQLEQSDEYILELNRKNLIKIHLNWFPLMRCENREIANPTDIDLIRLRIEGVVAPLKSHRDTAVAHRDKCPKYVAASEVDFAFNLLKEFLDDFSVLNHFINASFELGGIAAIPADSADAVSDIVLFNQFEREQRIIDRHSELSFN